MNNKYKSKPIIAVIIILLLCVFAFFVFKQSFTTFSENNDYSESYNENDFDETDMIDDYEKNKIVPSDINKNSQWAFNNDGSFSDFSDISNESWGDDEKIAKAGFDINISNISSIYLENRSVLVSVIDTGVDIYHYAFKNKIWSNEDEIDNDGLDNDKNGYIDDVYGWNFYENNNKIYSDLNYLNQHGTHLLGILCGEDINNNCFGLLGNCDAKIMCLQALNSYTSAGKIDNIINAIKYAENNDAKICCLSLSTYVHDEELFNVMSKSKMLFIVAAGNDGMDLDNEIKVYPASFKLSNMIVVADLRCDGKLSKISNYGSETVDVAAPGTDIISTIPGGDYRYLCGTSCAAAYVAGEAALIYCKATNELSAEEIKTIILSNVRNIDETDGKVRSNGMIDCYLALKNTK